MKTYNITIISALAFVAVLISSCNTEPTIIGHWRCDTTGTMTGREKDKDIIRPITYMYDGFQMPPLEFEFKEGGEMIWYNSMSSHTENGKRKVSFSDKEVGYSPNYNGDKNKVMILTDSGEDESLLTIVSVTSSKLVVSVKSLNDDMILDLKMNRVK